MRPTSHKFSLGSSHAARTAETHGHGEWLPRSPQRVWKGRNDFLTIPEHLSVPGVFLLCGSSIGLLFSIIPVSSRKCIFKMVFTSGSAHSLLKVSLDDYVCLYSVIILYLLVLFRKVFLVLIESCEESPMEFILFYCFGFYLGGFLSKKKKNPK